MTLDLRIFSRYASFHESAVAMFSPDPKAFSVVDTASALEIRFNEPRLGSFNIQEIGDTILQLVETLGPRTLLLDFDKVVFLDSAVLNKIVVLHRTAQPNGGRVRVVNLDPRLYEVFHVTRLNTLFEVVSKKGE